MEVDDGILLLFVCFPFFFQVMKMFEEKSEMEWLIFVSHPSESIL